MLNASTVLRVAALLVVAGVLAALVQSLWSPRTAQTPAPPPTIAAPQGPAKAPVRQAEPAIPPETRPAPQPAAPPPSPPPVTEAPPAPVEPPPPAPAPVPASPPMAAPTSRSPEPPPEEAPGPTGLVDLNTAPVADLNHLRGGGAIGRAIVQHRPYASVEQLLSKRVLSRAVYERIKDQVIVRQDRP